MATYLATKGKTVKDSFMKKSRTSVQEEAKTQMLSVESGFKKHDSIHGPGKKTEQVIDMWYPDWLTDASVVKNGEPERIGHTE